MREDLLKELEAEYEEQRRANERTELSRKAGILEKEPEIAALIREREQLIRGTLRDMLRGAGGSGAELPEKMEQISARIRTALTQKGYPEDWLAPVSSCPKCGDTGYVGEVVKSPCECLKKRYQQKLRSRLGLDASMPATFETFDLSIFPDAPLPGSGLSQRALMASVRDLCEAWANHYPDNRRRDVMLMGKSGLGKTFLLHCMANRLLERGVELRLLSAFGFLQTARKSYFENEPGIEELLEIPVLMLDDLGSEPLMQNVTIEQLFNLINERQRRNLSTVISTNLNPKEFRIRYTERIASRMTDTRNAMVITLEGEDVRRGGRG